MRAQISNDALSGFLSKIRLSGSLQFCFTAAGSWQTDSAPSMAGLSGGQAGTMPFHIVATGNCWLKIDEIETEVEPGDVLLFPFGTGHQLGVGSDGVVVTPTRDLPPKPWSSVPVLRYGEEGGRVRLLCGYLLCDAVRFLPLRQHLPHLIHVRSGREGSNAWLRATIEQMVHEVDHPKPGGISILERLAEVVFIEILRHRMTSAEPGAAGWIAALGDPQLSRSLSAMHDSPQQKWTLAQLASVSGMSRSAFAEHFSLVLGISPIRYLRDWRLYLASVALATTDRSLTLVAQDAGYDTEAAFSRAFARIHGKPPAAWRSARRSASLE